MIRGGKIVETGTYEQVMASKKDLYNLIVEFGKRAEEAPEEADTDESSMTLVNTLNDDSAVVSDEDEDLIDGEPMKPTIMRRKSTTIRRASLASFRRGKVPSKGLDEEHALLTEQKKEHSEQGKVKWNVYIEYAEACGIIGILFHFLFIIGAQAAQVGIILP
jgi:hypothetical protein